jgi:DNA primase
MYIEPEQIEEVRERADLLEVISDYVPLKKKGQNFVGLCPFHNEKTPSFTVNPEKQVYSCFGCGERGNNAIAFLMGLKKGSFQDAVLELANKYSVKIEPKQNKHYNPHEVERLKSEREQLIEINAIAARFYQFQLNNNPEIKKYLIDRGLTQETIDRFQLGYAPSGSRLKYYLVDQKKYSPTLVAKSGLLNRSSSNDYFANRIIIPVYDDRGNIIAFGGRALLKSQESKYLNTPETVLFSKGQTLYGLNFAKGAIAQQDYAILCEGYFDVIALHQAGFSNAIASMGTAIKTNQIAKALKYTKSKKIIVNLDGDQAGIKATEGLIRELKGQELDLHILMLPGSKDPADFLRDRPKGDYQKLLDSAPFVHDWQLDRKLAQVDINNGSQVKALLKELSGFLVDINLTLRPYYLDRCATALSCHNPALKQGYVKALSSRPFHQEYINKGNPSIARTDIEELEFILLYLYIHDVNCRENTKNMIDALISTGGFVSELHKRVWEELSIENLDLTEITQSDLFVPTEVYDAYLSDTDVNTYYLIIEIEKYRLNNLIKDTASRWSQAEDPKEKSRLHHEYLSLQQQLKDCC